MSFGDTAEQRTYIMFCVELGTDGDQTTTGKDTEWKQCFQSLCLSMAQTFSEDFSAPLSSKTAGRHTLIMESLTLNMLNSRQHGARICLGPQQGFDIIGR